MFKLSPMIATSAFLFMSGTADLFAMKPLEDADQSTSNVLLGPLSYMPKDLLGVVFIEASKNTNPRRLTSVCKNWYSIIREDNIPQMAELHYLATNILHTAMNPFMQRCMHTYWENLFYNGILRYTPVDKNRKIIESSATVTLKFSDFKDGTFDLSACGDTSKYLVITTSMERFSKVEEENKDKTVILIALRHLVEQGINKSEDHSFVPLVKAWDADKAPVGMFWRWGSDKTLFLVDSLTTVSMSKISSCNLYENWRAEAMVTCSRGLGMGQDVFLSIF